MDRIYALDMFDDISPEALPGDMKRNSVTITFNVKEKPAITRLFFKGNKQIRTAEIKDAISSKEKDIFNSAKISVDERSIRDLYLEKGYTNAKVTSSTKETSNGVEVTFSIEEGRSTVVGKINFSGNKVISA